MIPLIPWWLYLIFGIIGFGVMDALPDIFHFVSPFGLIWNGLFETISHYAYLPLIVAAIFSAISFYENRQPEYIARRYLRD